MSKKNKPVFEAVNYTGLGLLFGAALGLVIWLTTDLFVFFPVFIGAGMTVGLALGEAKNQDQDQ